MVAVPFNNLITFSRGSNATVTGSNGLIQWAPNNQITFSEQMDNAAWTKSNVTVVANVAVAPDGTSTADRLVPSNANTTKFTNGSPNFQVGAGQGVAYSCYVKADGYSKIALRESATTGAYASFDMATETLIETGNAGGIVVSNASITAVGNGWYRLTMTCTNPASTATHGFGAWPLSPSYTTGQPSSLNWTGNGTSGILLWGAQLELGSTATTYNPTTVKNLLGFSEAFDNAAWTKIGASFVTGAQANPVNGLFNAQKLMENTANSQHYVAVTVTAPSAPMTLSVYAKAAGRSWLTLYLGAANTSAYFNLDTGALGTVQSGVTASITSIGSGWYRCSITALSGVGGALTRGIYAANADNSNTYTGDGNSGVYIYGAQLSDSASLDPYVPTPGAAPSSAAFYGPRFDFDPVTLQPRGLLVEEQRTNLVLRSEEFNNTSAWGVIGIAVTANTTVAPSGETTADTITSTSTTGVVIFPAGAGVSASATSYTASCYVKPGSAAWIVLSLWQGSGTLGVNAWFNAQTGAVGSNNATAGYAFTSASSTAVGNGWYRITVTGTVPAAALFWSLRLVDGDNAFVYTNTVGDTMFLYGAQLEAGAFATSYIPTVASTVTRSADVATITGQNFAQWYRQDEGAWAASFAPYVVPGGVAAQISAATNNDRFQILTDSTGQIAVSAGGVGQGTIDAGTVIAGTNNLAYAFRVNDTAASLSGGAAVADTTVTLPVVDRLCIGATVTPAGFLNGHIRSIRFVPARAADFQLQGLTT